MDPLSDAESKVNSRPRPPGPPARSPRPSAGRALRGLRLALARRRRAARRRQRLAALIDEALEGIAAASAPLACSPGDCRRELAPALARAARHLRCALAEIPGPVELAAARWSQDPLLRALFVTPAAIHRFLAADTALRAHFVRTGAGAAYALLTARRRERTVFAPLREGDILRRDEAQTVVEFEELELLEPSADEEALRRAAARRLLGEVAGRRVAATLALRRRREELREQKTLLAAQWKIAATRRGGTEAARPPEALAALAREIESLADEAAGGREFLRRLAALFAAPEKAFAVRPLRLHLNWLGVKLPRPRAPGEAAEIALAEWVPAEGERRVALFVRVPRSEWLACGGRPEPL